MNQHMIGLPVSYLRGMVSLLENFRDGDLFTRQRAAERLRQGGFEVSEQPKPQFRPLSPSGGRGVRGEGSGTARLMRALVCAGVIALGGAVTDARAQSSRATPLTTAVQKTTGSVLSLEIMKGKTENGSGGSAVIVDERGYAVTNRHVVRDAVSINAYLPDCRQLVAEVVFEDHRHDLAILKLHTDRKLKALKLGSSTDLLLGETVIAVGSPKGLTGSVSRGIISGLEREIQTESTYCLKRLIQTDASINPGNSGGPLINLDGEVIGIIVAAHKDARGIAYAIPSDTVKEVLGSYLSARIASVRTWDCKRAGMPRSWLYYDVAKAEGNRTPPADVSTQPRDAVVPQPEVAKKVDDASKSDAHRGAGEVSGWLPPSRTDSTGNAFFRSASFAHPNDGVLSETLWYAAAVYAFLSVGVVAFGRFRSPSYRIG